MEAPRSKKPGSRYTSGSDWPSSTEASDYSFDVVCTIGTVTPGDGSMSMLEAAFSLIAKHGAPGEFSFPGYRVAVEKTGEAN